MTKSMIDVPLTRFPATEALELSRTRLPEHEYKRVLQQRSAIEASHQRSASLDVADLMLAVQPIEESIAFPSIDWDRDGEDEDMIDQSYSSSLTHRLPNRESSPFSSLGKRGRSESSRLSRSKTLRVSLCNYGEQSGCLSWEESHSFSDFPEFTTGRSRSADGSSRRRKPLTESRHNHIQFEKTIIAPLA